MLTFDFEDQHFTRDGAPISLSKTEISYMHSLKWREQIPLGVNLLTPGRIPVLQRREKYFLLDHNFEGRSALWIGCNEGFPLFYAKACGASRAVGLSTTFNLIDDLNPARGFLKQKLSGDVEFLDIDPLMVSPDTVGMFDSVFISDCLHQVSDPLRLLANAASVTKGGLFISNSVLSLDEVTPRAELLPAFEPLGKRRNFVAFNKAWVQSAIVSIGFEEAFIKSWAPDYIAACASRPAATSNESSDEQKQELPIDESIVAKTAVVVMSCKKYEEVWAPFFEIFNKFWPDCPFKIYFGTDTGSVNDVQTLQVGKDLGWSSNALQVLGSIPEEQIILFQEDFFLCGPVDTNWVKGLVTHLAQHEVGMIRLTPLPGPTGFWKESSLLGTIGPFDDWRFSFQLSLWNKKVYMDLLSEGEDPWVTEFEAARRSVLLPAPFLSILEVASVPIPYLSHAIVGGEWQDSALELLKSLGIKRSSSSRKINPI